MEYYKPAPPVLIIRVNVKRQGEKTMHINLCETTLDEVERLVKEAIEEKNISPFQKGSVINVEMREALGGDNLKSISLSFRGLTIQETHDILKTKFTQEIIGPLNQIIQFI